MCARRLRSTIVVMHSHMTTHLVAAMQAEAQLAASRPHVDLAARRPRRYPRLRRRSAATPRCVAAA